MVSQKLLSTNTFPPFFLLVKWWNASCQALAGHVATQPETTFPTRFCSWMCPSDWILTNVRSSKVTYVTLKSWLYKNWAHVPLPAAQDLECKSRVSEPALTTWTRATCTTSTWGVAQPNWDLFQCALHAGYQSLCTPQKAVKYLINTYLFWLHVEMIKF